MKPIALFLMIFPFVVQGQYSYLKLENTQVYFERVFEVDSTNASNIETMLLSEVPNLENLNDFKSSPGIITATIKDARIDYKKYGGTWVNTVTYLKYPFYGNVTIVWKENRYKVTVSSMSILTSNGKFSWSDVLTSNRGSEFDSKEIVIRSGEYIENYLSELFLIKSKSNDW